MVTAGVGSKYASAYDTSFYWKEFPGRLHLIKTKAGFYKISAWIYFLRREKSKTDLSQIGFRVLFKNFKNLILSLDYLTVDVYSNLIKKRFINRSNQITPEHVKHNKSLY